MLQAVPLIAAIIKVVPRIATRFGQTAPRNTGLAKNSKNFQGTNVPTPTQTVGKNPYSTSSNGTNQMGSSAEKNRTLLIGRGGGSPTPPPAEKLVRYASVGGGLGLTKGLMEWDENFSLEKNLGMTFVNTTTGALTGMSAGINLPATLAVVPANYLVGRFLPLDGSPEGSAHLESMAHVGLIALSLNPKFVPAIPGLVSSLAHLIGGVDQIKDSRHANGTQAKE